MKGRYVWQVARGTPGLSYNHLAWCIHPCLHIMHARSPWLDVQ